jgi:radical SAM protein with 4Fe4S-binding SPASM domain
MKKYDESAQNAVFTYKFLLDNRIMRKVLCSLSEFCIKDGADRLQIALEMFAGVRKESCALCHLASLIIKPFLASASRSFGSNKEQLRERLRDPYWRRGLISVIKGIGWFGAAKPHVPGAPFQIVWNVTRACNLRCKHCYADAGTFDRDELSTKEALNAIDILADAGVLIIAFSGGEPTIKPDILKLMKHSSDRGIYVAMATNAILFSSHQKVKDFKENGLQFVQISLDGANPQTHDSFRGMKGSFDSTIKGIRNCVAEGLFVEVATTVTKYNYQEIPSIINLTEKLGANWFMTFNFVPTGRGKEMIEADLEPNEREELLKTLWHQMKIRKINVLSTAPQFARIAQQCELEGNETIVPTHFYNPTLSGNLKRLADFIGGCGAGRFYLAMEPNGDLYPCVFFPRDEQVKLGNILKIDFEYVWRNSDLLWKLRNKDILKEKCGKCKYRYTCGGCRARAYNYFRDVLAPDPGCINNAKYWVELRSRLQELEVKNS